MISLISWLGANIGHRKLKLYGEKKYYDLSCIMILLCENIEIVIATVLETKLYLYMIEVLILLLKTSKLYFYFFLLFILCMHAFSGVYLVHITYTLVLIDCIWIYSDTNFFNKLMKKLVCTYIVTRILILILQCST